MRKNVISLVLGWLLASQLDYVVVALAWGIGILMGALIF